MVGNQMKPDSLECGEILVQHPQSDSSQSGQTTSGRTTETGVKRQRWQKKAKSANEWRDEKEGTICRLGGCRKTSNCLAWTTRHEACRGNSSEYQEGDWPACP